MSKDFKQFFYEYLERVLKTPSKHYLLKESPLYTGIYNNYLNDNDAKKSRVKDIKQFDKQIKNYKNFVVYYGKAITKGGKDYSFLFNDNLMATFTILPLKDKGMEILSVWNDIFDGKGLARQLIFEYFLPKYNYILCGESHTEQGKQFWIKIITEALQKNIKCFLINIKDKTEIMISDVSYLNDHKKEIWGSNRHDIRLKIRK